MRERELIPREITSGIPRLTLTGSERLHIEQHRGIIACQPEEMLFRTSVGELRVCGSDLRLSLYAEGESIITGSIAQISITPGGGRA